MSECLLDCKSNQHRLRDNYFSCNFKIADMIIKLQRLRILFLVIYWCHQFRNSLFFISLLNIIEDIKRKKIFLRIKNKLF